MTCLGTPEKVVKSDSPVETITDISASYDLLILGTPEKDNWIKVLFGREANGKHSKQIYDRIDLTLECIRQACSVSFFSDFTHFKGLKQEYPKNIKEYRLYMKRLVIQETKVD